MIRQRIGSGAIGKCRQGNDDAYNQQPPRTIKKQSAAHSTGSNKSAHSHPLERVGLDVAFGYTTARTNATFFVGTTQKVIVFVGKVTHNLCQQGKQQAQHGRRPSQAPPIISQSHCNHHARQRYGQSAQSQGFNPYFQLFHRFLLGFLVWNCAEELSSASKQRIIASRITLASGPSCLRMRKMVLK